MRTEKMECQVSAFFKKTKIYFSIYNVTTFLLNSNYYVIFNCFLQF